MKRGYYSLFTLHCFFSSFIQLSYWSKIEFLFQFIEFCWHFKHYKVSFSFLDWTTALLGLQPARYIFFLHLFTFFPDCLSPNILWTVLLVLLLPQWVLWTWIVQSFTLPPLIHVGNSLRWRSDPPQRLALVLTHFQLSWRGLSGYKTVHLLW